MNGMNEQELQTWEWIEKNLSKLKKDDGVPVLIAKNGKEILMYQRLTIKTILSRLKKNGGLDMEKTVENCPLETDSGQEKTQIKEKILEKKWTDIASAQLLGRTIKKVRYLTDKEAEHLGWASRCVVLILDNGNYVFPSADDEGNDAGAFFTVDEKHPVLPVLPAFSIEEQA